MDRPVQRRPSIPVPWIPAEGHFAPTLSAINQDLLIELHDWPRDRVQQKEGRSVDQELSQDAAAVAEGYGRSGPYSVQGYNRPISWLRCNSHSLMTLQSRISRGRPRTVIVAVG